MSRKTKVSPEEKVRIIRKYKDEAIPEDKLTNIVRAGLLAPSSRGISPVEFVVVPDKNALERLSESKAGGATMLKTQVRQWS